MFYFFDEIQFLYLKSLYINDYIAVKIRFLQKFVFLYGSVAKFL